VPSAGSLLLALARRSARGRSGLFTFVELCTSGSAAAGRSWWCWPTPSTSRSRRSCRSWAEACGFPAIESWPRALPDQQGGLLLERAAGALQPL